MYTSSCSVYGAGRNDMLTEESPTNPQTTYARCKVLVESDIGALADDRFSPVFLRNATAYGASPRMRFDLVLNNLAGLARTTGQITMTSDGTPWRPLVHVLDICDAIAHAAEAPREAIHRQIFNVGDNGQNYRVREIAALVGDVFTGCEVVLGSDADDRRSYRVSFDKIRRGTSRLSVRVGRAQRRRTAASAVRTDRSHARAVQVSCVHPPRRTEVPDTHAAAGPRAVLETLMRFHRTSLPGVIRIELEKHSRRARLLRAQLVRPRGGGRGVEDADGPGQHRVQ